MMLCHLSPHGGCVTGNGGVSKLAVDAGPSSRTMAWLWRMTGRDNVSEVSVLRIVIGAELKRLKGSRPKKGTGSRFGRF